MLPFLQDKDAVIAQGSEEKKEYSTVDAIAEDMMSALKKGDSSLLKSALESLCEYIKEEDISQDSKLNKE